MAATVVVRALGFGELFLIVIVVVIVVVDRVDVVEFCGLL